MFGANTASKLRVRQTKKLVLSADLDRNLNDEAVVPKAKPAHTKELKRVGVMGWGGIWW